MANKNICTTGVLGSLSSSTNAIVETNGELARFNLYNKFNAVDTQINKLNNLCTYGNEVVVGQLSDGTPIYNKTISFSGDAWTNTTNYTLYQIAHGISGLRLVLDINISGCSTTKTDVYPIPFYSVNGTLYTFLYNINTNSMSFYNKGTAWTGYTIVVNIKYTKA